MIASSVAALGGLAIAAYQVIGPAYAPDKAQPVQVSVSVDQNGNATAAAKPVTTASSAQVTDAGKLLNNMRASLGLIAESYADEVKKPGAHQSGGLVLASTKETATALNDLDGAIKSKDTKKISGSSKNATRSIGKLQTNYALAATKPKRAETGMKTLNNNWNAYAARYMVQTDRKVAQSAAETKKLKKRVRKLGTRVDELEKRTRDNEALNREVIRVRERLDYEGYDYEDEEDYAGLLITLAFIDGAFEALSVSSQHYYPEYYDDLRYDPGKYNLADTYWDGYYDGYYDGRDDAWYEKDYAVPQVVVLQPDPVIIQYQEINYTQIINVTNEAAVAYEALPAEELTKAKIEPVANGVVSDAQAIKAIATAEPAAEGPEAAAAKQDAPASEEPAFEAQQPAADTAATGEPSAGTEAPAQDQPAAEEPVAEQPAAATTAEQPAAEEPAAEQPAAETWAEQPAAEEPAAQTEQQVTQEPAAPAEETTTEAPPEETAAPAEEPAAEAPAEETAPAVEEPAAVAPAEEAAAPAEEPAAEAPAEETAPAVEEPAAVAPAEEAAAPAEEPAAEAPAEEQASPAEETAAPGEEQEAEPPADDAAAAQPAAECGGEGNPCPDQQ